VHRVGIVDGELKMLGMWVTFGFGPDFAHLAYEEKEDWESIPDNMLDCLYDTLVKDDADIFKIIIPHDDVVAMTTPTDETVNETVNETVKSILIHIKENPQITQRELCDILGKSRATITRSIKELQEKGLLVRVGADKNGLWEVTES
jgi:biotin operon repressor